jgi:hypothetical protein
MIILKEMELQEQLVPANQSEFEKLRGQIEKDPNLRRQLTLPMDNLPQYKFLYLTQDFIGSMSLFGALDYITNVEKKAKVLFSKAGDKFIGFIAYMDEGSKIDRIKMASFLNDQKKSALVMARDLKAFIDKEMKTHKSIEWSAYLDNPANKMYQTAVPIWFPQYGFIYGKDDKKTSWVYRIFHK